MRNVPQLVDQEFRKETIDMYRKLEKTELKISNLKNYQRFLLRSKTEEHH